MTSTSEVDIAAEYFRLKREGNEYFHKDDMVKAKECYEKAIECNPPKEVLAILHVNLATIYSREQPPNWTAVLEHSNLALEINPEDDRALFGRFRANDALYKYSEALDDITAICCLKTHDPMYSRALDTSIVKVAELDADTLVKNRTPRPRSKYNLDAYFKSFTCDPVAEWWSGRVVPTCCLPGTPLSDLILTHARKPKDTTGGDAGDTKQNLFGFSAAVWDLLNHKYSTIIDHCTQELALEDSKYKAEAHLLRGTFRFLWSYSTEEILADLEPITNGTVPAPMDIQVSAYIKLGELYTLLKDNAKVAFAFASAEEFGPDSPDPNAFYTCYLMECDRLYDAYCEIIKAIDKPHRNSAHAAIKYFLSFRLDAMKGDAMAPIEALDLFEKDTSVGHYSPELYVAFGHLFKDIREPLAAYMMFRRAVAQEPNNLSYAVNMTMMKFETTADTTICMKELNDILVKDPTCVCAYEALATLHISAGRNYDLAFEAISKGLKFAIGRHDYITFAILNKTAEVRKKIMSSYEANNRASGGGAGRYDKFLVDSWDTTSMD